MEKTEVSKRWGRIYAIGPETQDDYSVGDYVPVEHGRWTRGVELEDYEGNKKTLRMVEAQSIPTLERRITSRRHKLWYRNRSSFHPTHVAKDFVN